MKLKLVLLFIFIALLAISNLRSLMAITKPSPLENQYIISEVTQGVFQVKADDRLIIKEGDERDCQLARQLVTYALENQTVNLSGMEYTVELKKLITSFKKPGSDDLLVMYQYIVGIDSKQKKSSLTQFLMDLKSQDYLTDLVSQYQAPITCYYFLSDDKLILLTYYGLFPTYEGFNPQDFIEFLKV